MPTSLIKESVLKISWHVEEKAMSSLAILAKACHMQEHPLAFCITPMKSLVIGPPVSSAMKMTKKFSPKLQEVVKMVLLGKLLQHG